MYIEFQMYYLYRLKARISRIQYFHWAWHTHTLGVCECMNDFEIWIQLYDFFLKKLYVLLFELMYSILNWSSLPIILIWIRTWNEYLKINSYNQCSFILFGYVLKKNYVNPKRPAFLWACAFILRSIEIIYWTHRSTQAETPVLRACLLVLVNKWLVLIWIT